MGTQISTFLTGLGFGGEHFQIGKTKVCIICIIVVRRSTCVGRIFTHARLCVQSNNVNSCLHIIFVYMYLGVYEGETEAGSAGRAGGQGVGKNCGHPKVDPGKDTQVSIPTHTTISNCNTGTFYFYVS